MVNNGVITIRNIATYPKVLYISDNFNLVERILEILRMEPKDLSEFYRKYILAKSYPIHYTKLPEYIKHRIIVYEATPGVIVLGGFTLSKKQLIELYKKAEEMSFTKLIIKPAKYKVRSERVEPVLVIEYKYQPVITVWYKVKLLTDDELVGDEDE